MPSNGESFTLQTLSKEWGLLFEYFVKVGISSSYMLQGNSLFIYDKTERIILQLLMMLEVDSINVSQGLGVHSPDMP